jgi:hypothetical protein
MALTLSLWFEDGVWQRKQNMIVSWDTNAPFDKCEKEQKMGPKHFQVIITFGISQGVEFLRRGLGIKTCPN